MNQIPHLTAITEKMGSFFKKADEVCDTIPIISSLSNLVDLIEKLGIHLYETISGKKINPRDRYFNHIKTKSKAECAGLIALPLISNAVAGVRAWKRHQNKSLFKEFLKEIKEINPDFKFEDPYGNKIDDVIKNKTYHEYILFKNQNTSLSKDNYEAYSQALSKLTFLEKITLSDHNNDQLKIRLEDFKNLKKLDLTECTQLQSLPDSIENLDHLEELAINLNQFSEFPNQITNMKNLNSLSLTYVNTKIPKEIKNLKLLSKLILSYGNEENIDEIENLTQLTELEIKGCENNQLPEWINDLTNLKILIIKDLNLDSIPSLKDLSQLEFIDITGSITADRDGEVIPDMDLNEKLPEGSKAVKKGFVESQEFFNLYDSDEEND